MRSFRSWLVLFSIVSLFAILSQLYSVDATTAEHYLVNSKNWKDVYSTLLFTRLNDSTGFFLVSQKHANLIQNDITKDQPLHIFSSSKEPYVFGLQSLFAGSGFDCDEQILDNLNLAFADKLGDSVNGYIIIDDAYGYNAISVAPYAVLKKYFVLFADRSNINDIMDFLSSHKSENLIIYGQLDRDANDALATLNPEVINDGGDRFANNAAIVKKFLDDKPVKQVVLTDGEFIEQSLISDQFPIVFVGKSNVPDITRTLLQSNNINTGVLIGNDLVATATYLRRTLGMSIFVKFGRSSRSSTGIMNQVEGLDIFYLPSYQLGLDITGVRYNKITKQLEITFQNPVDVAIYFKGTYDIQAGTQTQTVGDLDVLFIDGKDTKTVVYDVEPLQGNDISVKASVLFGESRNSLEYSLEKLFTVETVQVLDDSNVDIIKAVYDKKKQTFLVTLQNTGTVDTYANTEIFDLSVDGVRTTVAAGKVIKLGPGKSGVSEIAVALTDRDLSDNPKIKVRAYYGQRDFSLIKTKEATFDLVVKTFDAMTYAPYAAIVVLLVLIILAMRRRKRKKRRAAAITRAGS